MLLPVFRTSRQLKAWRIVTPSCHPCHQTHPPPFPGRLQNLHHLPWPIQTAAQLVILPINGRGPLRQHQSLYLRRRLPYQLPQPLPSWIPPGQHLPVGNDLFDGTPARSQDRGPWGRKSSAPMAQGCDAVHGPRHSCNEQGLLAYIGEATLWVQHR